MVRWQKIIKMFLLCVLSKKMNLRITDSGMISGGCIPQKPIK